MEYLIPPDRLEAQGFVLRSYDAGDGPLLAEAADASYEHLRPHMPWAQPHTSVRSAEQRARLFRAKWLLAKDFVIAVVSEDGSTLLGGCGYHLREGGLDTLNAEIGMWIRGDAAGCGLGTRVLVALLDWGFGAWPWRRLSWRCSARNPRSARVAEKAGMEREGVLRGNRIEMDGSRGDTLVYSALKGAWRSPDA